MSTFHAIFSGLLSGITDGIVYAVADPGTGGTHHQVTVTVYLTAPVVVQLTTDDDGFVQSGHLTPPGTPPTLVKVEVAAPAAVALYERTASQRLVTAIPEDGVAAGLSFRLVRDGGDADVYVGNPGNDLAIVKVKQANSDEITYGVQAKQVKAIPLPSKKTYTRVTSDKPILVKYVKADAPNSTIVLPG